MAHSHVASVYPIEIDLARKIASGQAVTDVGWDAVAALNSKHAADHAEITKEAAADIVNSAACRV
jgi:hypothetical protein